jgi:hypothetical protein
LQRFGDTWWLSSSQCRSLSLVVAKNNESTQCISFHAHNT